MPHETSTDRRAATLSPSLTKDLHGVLGPGRTTWRETTVASVSSMLATAGLGLAAAGWWKYRSRRQQRTRP